MIALLVLTLVLGGVVHAVGAYAANQQRMRDTVLAQWVAMNRLTEARLGLLVTDVTHVNGSDRMGRQSWQWTIHRDAIAKTEGLAQLAVEVRPDRPDAPVLHRMSGLRFIAKPEKAD